MAAFQNTEIIGNVGRDPEMRYLQSGKPVCSFSVAVTEKWTGANGQPSEETTWYRVSAWDKLAETANSYVKKGMQIFVQGKIKASAYTAKDGTPAASLELTARSFQFLGSKDSNGVSDDTAADAQSGKPTDDIPF